MPGARARTGAAVKIHPREALVRQAESDLSEAVHRAMEKNATALTTIETLAVLNRVLSDCIARILKYEIREERHGDPNKPGGLA
jgi:hypothetical protein